MATKAKAGAQKVWTRSKMVQAGVDYAIKTGRRPSASIAQTIDREGMPTYTTIKTEYSNWSSYMTAVARAYKKQTGIKLPNGAKLGRPVGSKSTNGTAPKKRGRPVGSKNKPKPTSINTNGSPQASFPTGSMPSVEPKKGFWRSLFGR